MGLIVHRKRGDRGITRNGAAFLKNEIAIQEGVKTVKKKVVGHFGRIVYAREFDRKLPDFTTDAPPVERAREQHLVGFQAKEKRT